MDTWTVEWQHEGRPAVIAREVVDLKEKLLMILAYNRRLIELKVTFNG